MSDPTRYLWTNQSDGAWVDTESMRQELVADGVLVPDDSLQQKADAWSGGAERYRQWTLIGAVVLAWSYRRNEDE